MSKIDEIIEQEAFETFASIYPHEAYSEYPDKFMELAKRRHPNMTEEQILKILEETNEQD